MEINCSQKSQVILLFSEMLALLWCSEKTRLCYLYNEYHDLTVFILPLPLRISDFLLISLFVCIYIHICLMVSISTSIVRIIISFTSNVYVFIFSIKYEKLEMRLLLIKVLQKTVIAPFIYISTRLKE